MRKTVIWGIISENQSPEQHTAETSLVETLWPLTSINLGLEAPPLLLPSKTNMLIIPPHVITHFWIPCCANAFHLENLHHKEELRFWAIKNSGIANFLNELYRKLPEHRKMVQKCFVSAKVANVYYQLLCGRWVLVNHKHLCLLSYMRESNNVSS